MVDSGDEQLEYLDDDVQPVSSPGQPTYYGGNVVGSLHPVQAMGADVLQSALATKVQARHIINHHGATQMFLANQAVAQKLGLPDKVRDQIVPFPSPGRTTIINDGGSQALAAVTTKLIETLAQMARPNESSVSTTIIQPEARQSEKLDTPQPVTKPDVLVMKIADGSSALPSFVPSKLSFWQRIKNNSGLISTLLWAMTVLGGGAAYWQSTKTEPTAVVQPNDVQGNVKVTVE